MDTECEIVGEVKLSPSPLRKQLIQTRLPFSPLDSKTPQKTKSPTNKKKRRLSDSNIPVKSPKTPRSENKKGKPSSDKKPLKPSRKPNEGKAAREKEETTQRNRKRTRITSKAKSDGHESDKLSKLGCRMTSDDEVSSSVDDEVEVPKAKKKPIEKTRKLLSAFLGKEPTQQAEISTSTVDPLDEEANEITKSEKSGNENGSLHESEEIEISDRKEGQEKVIKSVENPNILKDEELAETGIEKVEEAKKTTKYETKETEINDGKEVTAINTSAEENPDILKDSEVTEISIAKVKKPARDETKEKILEEETVGKDEKMLASKTVTKRSNAGTKKIVVKSSKKGTDLAEDKKKTVSLEKTKKEVKFDFFGKQRKKGRERKVNKVGVKKLNKSELKKSEIKEIKLKENKDIENPKENKDQEETCEKDQFTKNEMEKAKPTMGKGIEIKRSEEHEEHKIETGNIDKTEEENEKLVRQEEKQHEVTEKLEISKGKEVNEPEERAPKMALKDDTNKMVEDNVLRETGDVKNARNTDEKEECEGKREKQEINKEKEESVGEREKQESSKEEEESVGEREKQDMANEEEKPVGKQGKSKSHEKEPTVMKQKQEKSKSEVNNKPRMKTEEDESKKEKAVCVGECVEQEREEAAGVDSTLKTGKEDDNVSETVTDNIKEKSETNEDCEIEGLDKEAEKIETEEIREEEDEEVDTNLKVKKVIEKEGDGASCKAGEEKITEEATVNPIKGGKNETGNKKCNTIKEKGWPNRDKSGNDNHGKAVAKKVQAKKITCYLSSVKSSPRGVIEKSNFKGESKEREMEQGNKIVEVLENVDNKTEQEKQSETLDVDKLDETNDDEDSDMEVTEDADSSSEVLCTDTKCLPPNSKTNCLKQRKLTPKQKEREAERQLKKDERDKKRLEREKKKQEEIAEKDRIKKEKEEERLKLKEEREKMKDAKRQKREEEQQRKEEEKKQKEEAKKQAEDEKQKQKDLLKNKFVSFFVAKKRETGESEECENGPFKQFQVKEVMRLAPVNRKHLTEEQQLILDNYLSGKQTCPSKTYIEILKSENYVKGMSNKTWPHEEKKEEIDDDIEIIEDEEDGLENMDGMIEDVVARMTKVKHIKGKLLSFCENRRPAYWGTWNKNSSSVSARRPFAKDKIFDYEYDSDDDWEEEETGESLSDSEGEEKEEEGDGDQYEVDNDFFVPHGYLSDDEGRSDEEDAQAEAVSEDDDSKNKEKLKLKQAEFEEEMKKKTKTLKPRVMGCLWMADKNNNRAYDQLLKILNPHKAVRLCSQLPIGTRYGGVQLADNKDKPEDEAAADDKNGARLKYFKTFPEEAVPSLIRLLHGNRNGKVFLSREFPDFWRNKEVEGNVENMSNPKTHSGYFLARKKVEAKIQELGRWRKCPDEGPSHKVMMWYVPKEIRDKHGLEELSVPNTWNYINKPKERRDIIQDDVEAIEEGSKVPKTKKLIPITAFAKKIPQSPVTTTTSPTSSTNAISQTPDTDISCNPGMSRSPPSAVSADSTSLTPPSSTLIQTPLGKTSSGQSKKKIAFISLPREQETATATAQQASFVSFFKKSEGSSKPANDSKKEKSQEQDNEEMDCITLD
ncbi:axoneme-associated protein mst101(2) [Procambarus clarkii]|uniref:axoneme-associated protein mst101(2) n=1 Tax=Procambarus clarkii TaxID=6728 RepID=UPI003741F400